MLRAYREVMRQARAAKQAKLDAWWCEERRLRALYIRARVVRGLTSSGRVLPWGESETKRLRDALTDAVVGAQAATAEGGRGGGGGHPPPHTQRGGGEPAGLIFFCGGAA